MNGMIWGSELIMLEEVDEIWVKVNVNFDVNKKGELG